MGDTALNITPHEIERRRKLIASFNQMRAASYARYADYYRSRYLKTGWRRWFAPFDQKWVREQIEEFQIMAEVHALTARLLMGIDP